MERGKWPQQPHSDVNKALGLGRSTRSRAGLQIGGGLCYRTDEPNNRSTEERDKPGTGLLLKRSAWYVGKCYFIRRCLAHRHRAPVSFQSHLRSARSAHDGGAAIGFFHAQRIAVIVMHLAPVGRCFQIELRCLPQAPAPDRPIAYAPQFLEVVLPGRRSTLPRSSVRSSDLREVGNLDIPRPRIQPDRPNQIISRELAQAHMNLPGEFFAAHADLRVFPAQRLGQIA